MIAAKKSVARPPQRRYEWSLPLEKAGQTVMFWITYYHQQRQNLPLTPYLKKLQNKLSIVLTKNFNKKETKKALSQAWTNLRNIQKTHIQLQINHLEQLAEFYSEQ